MFASANALSKRLTRSLSCFKWSISFGVSTRIIFPRLPWPYFCTHLCTVSQPPIPYLCRSCSKGSCSRSNSPTTSILNASLYRIAGPICPFFFISSDNLGQDGTFLSGFGLRVSDFLARLQSASLWFWLCQVRISDFPPGEPSPSHSCPGVNGQR